MYAAKQYITKELLGLGMVLALLAVAEYLLLVVVDISPLPQVMLQAVIGLIFIARLLRTSHRIWHHLDENDFFDSNDDKSVNH